MSLVTQTIANLYNGVSQQPPASRDLSQCEAQEDCYSALAAGLTKRPPVHHIAELINAPVANIYCHFIDRGVGDRWVAIAHNGTIRVFNADTGAEASVSAPAGWGYISSAASPRDDILMLTVADYTFVVNRQVTVAMDAAVVPGTLGAQVQRFSDLPAAGGASGQIRQVAGDNTSSFDDYYVRSNGTVWVEHVKPGITYKLDPATMPYRLVRNGPTSFIFTQNIWADRLVGDDVSNPDPSFVGRKISELFFYRNRLGFLSGDNVVLTRAGDPFNLFAKTSTLVSDEDPIDLSVAHPRVAILRHAVSLQGALVLFGDRVQFELDGGEVLSPKTARIVQTTEFETITSTRPVGSGATVFFAVPRGGYIGVREYYVDPDSSTNQAPDITAQIPAYMPGPARELVASPNEDLLMVRTGNANLAGSLYVYKFYWDPSTQRKLQSSWSRFNIALGAGDAVEGAGFYGTKLILVVRRGTKLFLESMEFQESVFDLVDDAGNGIKVHLDRRWTTTSGVYDSATQTTSWTLPYPVATGQDVVVGVCIDPNFPALEGDSPAVTMVTSTLARVQGDYSGAGMVFGVPYESVFEFSEQFVRNQQGAAALDGRLQMRYFSVLTNLTGFLEAEVIRPGQSTGRAVFTAKSLGNYTLGSSSLVRDRFRFPVYGNSRTTRIRIKSKSYLPFAVQSAEWEGFYVPRSRRM